jgi:hypothetical protein
MVKEHLEQIVSKNYTHIYSQKEEVVDKEYLQQWMKDNTRTK